MRTTYRLTEVKQVANCRGRERQGINCQNASMSKKVGWGQKFFATVRLCIITITIIVMLCYSSLVKRKRKEKIACLCDHVAQCTVFYYCHVLSIFLVNQTKHCLSVDLYCYYSHFSLSFHLIQFMSLSDFYSVIINPPNNPCAIIAPGSYAFTWSANDDLCWKKVEEGGFRILLT